jgi:hypothetical protein
VKRQIAIFSAFALLAGIGGAEFAAPSAFAQSAPSDSSAPAPGQTGHAWPGKPDRPRLGAGQLVEGRIAFLKTELAITPQQQAAFDKLAQAMRDNAKERDANFQAMRAQAGTGMHSAVQFLETKSRFEALKAQQDGRILAAFRPLYDSLSDQQKQTADALMVQHMHRHHHDNR